MLCCAGLPSHGKAVTSNAAQVKDAAAKEVEMAPASDSQDWQLPSFVAMGKNAGKAPAFPSEHPHKRSSSSESANSTAPKPR